MHTGTLQPEAATLHIANTREEIDRAETQLLTALERFKYPEASRFAVRLALEEALVNAFRHGHKNLPASETIRFAYEITSDKLTIEIEDKGPGFDVSAVKDPTLEENLEAPTGRGLFLMRAYMSSLEYLGRGNHVRMVYTPTPKT